MQMRWLQSVNMSIFRTSLRPLLQTICSDNQMVRNASWTMIVEDIHKALDAGHIRHGAQLFMALQHFLEQHPETNPELAQ